MTKGIPPPTLPGLVWSGLVRSRVEAALFVTIRVWEVLCGWLGGWLDLDECVCELVFLVFVGFFLVRWGGVDGYGYGLLLMRWIDGLVYDSSSSSSYHYYYSRFFGHSAFCEELF